MESGYTKFATGSGWLITDIVIVTRSLYCVSLGTMEWVWNEEKMIEEKMSTVKCKTIKYLNHINFWWLWLLLYCIYRNVCLIFNCFKWLLFVLLFVIFNPWKVSWNWIAFSQNSFFVSPGLLYYLIRSDTGQLANEAFTSNTTVSSKQ